MKALFATFLLCSTAIAGDIVMDGDVVLSPYIASPAHWLSGSSGTNATARIGSDGSYVGANCLSFDGADTIDSAHLVGSETAVSWDGTSASIVITSGTITPAAGTVANLVLSDGTVYSMSEGSGTAVYDASGGDNTGTISGATWAVDTSGTITPWNVVNGFSGCLESDGNQYFDTGVHLTEDHEVEIWGEWTDTTTTAVLIGQRTVPDQDDWMLYIGSYNIISIQFGDFYRLGSYVGVSPNTESHFKMNKNGLWVDGVQSDTFDGYTFADGGTRTAYLLSWNDNGVATYNAKFKLRRAKIRNNGALVRDYIPQGDNAIYDLVNGTTTTFSGSGSFVKTYTPALSDGSADALGNEITNPGGYVHNGFEGSLVWAGGTNTLAGLQALNGATNLPIKNVYYFDSAPSALFTNTIINIAPWNGVWEVAQ